MKTNLLNDCYDKFVTDEMREKARDMRLSQHFTLEEFVYSETAIRKGIDNYPTNEAITNLLMLCRDVLEPAREEYGKAMIISSGYRCEELNRAVGGAKTSQHMTGCAADIVCSEPRKLFDIIKRQGKFDQLLWEHSGKTQWLHVSYKSNGKNRQQAIDNYQA
jgi:hypothetical protein